MAERKGSGFLVHTIVVAIAVWVATQVVSGVSASGPVPLLIMAVVLGLVNAIVRPIMVLLTLPLTVITLGLFYLVVNGLAFGLAAALVPGFHVAGLWAAILAGIHHGIVNRVEPGPMVMPGQVIDEHAVLPVRWEAALDAFEAGKVLPRYLGERYHALYAACRREECDRFHAQITDRDYEWYLRGS